MKISVAELRKLIKEELELTPAEEHAENARIYQHLKSIIAGKKPYLKGSWVKKPGKMSAGDVWIADDPAIGPVRLSFQSDTSSGRDKHNSMLRDPTKTRHTYRAQVFSEKALKTMSFGHTFFDKVVNGEDSVRQLAMERLVSNTMLKLFGVDPYDWKFKHDRAREDEEKAKVASTKKPASQPSQLGKELKIYGKLKGAPAHTRLKGKAYVAAADTQFKNGERATVAPEGDKIRVKKSVGDHSQLWEPE